MYQLYNICGASPVNNQIFFFDGHDSHFDDLARIHMDHQNIQPFILKAGDSGNNQPNDNGQNVKLKSIYNEAKSEWMLKYRTANFSPHHMNTILVESWDAFRVSSGKVKMYNFAKTKLSPLSPTKLTTNNQACAASI